ncbi:hypothetical protein ACFQ0R_13155 [Psychroflexus salinarum]|uniref:PH domain-containing protein n=1 Tax=Psychroflexus salinarum TaxID=546024 RepID=A0ABW3GTZ8_9FLAO
MRIKLTKKKLYTHLILGLVWSGFGVIYILLNDENVNWLGIGFIAIGLFDILHYVYDSKHQYLLIENGVIRKNILYGFKNKIDIDDIHQIKSEGGNYILKSDLNTFKIDPGLIEKNSLEDLNKFLKDLDLPSDKNFLTS